MRRRRSRDPLLTGLLALAVIVAFVAVSLTHSLPFTGDHARRVTAEFATARQVNANTPVRVRGIEVGKVASVRFDPRRRIAEVEMRLTDDGLRLHRDASAALRWRTVLGGRMELALDPGSPSAPELSGDDRIPVARTRIQTEFEDLTKAFDGRGTRAFLQELPQALEGPHAGRAVDSLATLKPLGRAMRALRGERDHDLAGLVRSSARTLQAMDRARGALGAFVDGGGQTFGVTAARRAELTATFRESPAALAATTGVSRAIDRTLPGLDGLVDRLRPGARRLGPALATARPTLVRLDQVLSAARPLVRSLRPAVDRLAGASASGRRVLRALDPTLRRASSDLLPWLEADDDDVRMPLYQLIGPTISSLNGAGSPFHDQGHMVNFPVQPAENSFSFIPCSTFVTDPSAAEKARCEGLNRVLRDVLSPEGAKR